MRKVVYYCDFCKEEDCDDIVHFNFFLGHQPVSDPLDTLYHICGKCFKDHTILFSDLVLRQKERNGE